MDATAGEPGAIAAARIRDEHPDFPGIPQIEAAYDRIAPRYEDLHQDNASLDEDEWIRRDLAPFLRAPIVELGSGTGLLLDLLDIDPVAYTGLELSKGMIEVAQGKYPHHRFLHRDMHSVAVHFTLRRAQLVIALFGVIEHSPIPSVLFREIRRALEPGGVFYAILMTDAHVHDPFCDHNLYAPPGSLIPYSDGTHLPMLASTFGAVTTTLMPSRSHPGHYVRIVATA